MGRGGEIFILDMGEPVRIVDLAKDMIRLSGLRPGDDVEIRFTGIRSGEKLYEELQTIGEAIAKTRHPKIFIGRIAPLSPQEMADALENVRQLCASDQEGALRQFLGQLLPGSRIRSTAVAARDTETTDVAEQAKVPTQPSTPPEPLKGVPAALLARSR
jgi:FlaA1/EpsC-like NDP-sugar epimerase